MKGVTDIFISKQKLAIFWFLVSLGCIVGTAWHLYGIAIEGRSRMLYVPIEDADVYLDRNLTRQDLDEIVDFQTRLTLETFLNRGPKGPVTPDRLGYLFSPSGYEQAVLDIKDNGYDFRTRQIHQMLELGEVSALHNPDGSATTRASGQLVRVSIDPTENQAITQSFGFIATMNWERNKNLRDKKRFLFVCTDLQYILKEISSSEK
ncbi:MAG: hypothetical protein OJI67_18375 [Prosthecobacter sp.]|nr:hypothetical protein [Prosthecobacter sp.]